MFLILIVFAEYLTIQQALFKIFYAIMGKPCSQRSMIIILNKHEDKYNSIGISANVKLISL